MAQFLRPDNDDSIGSWQDDGGGTTDIYQAIDEVTRSDTDFVRSENDPGNSAYVIGMSSGVDPGVNTGHIIRYAYDKSMSGGGQPGQIDITVEWRQGTTVIGSQVHTDVADSVWTAGSFTLTGTEADSITDYTNFNVRLIANKPSGARTSWGKVSWVEIELPSAGSSLLEIVNETANYSEATLALLKLKREIAETTNYSEGTLSLLALKREIAETASYSEGTVAHLDMTRITNETLNVSEGTIGHLDLVRMLSSTANVSEAVAQILGIVRDNADTFNLSETTVNILGKIQSISETANFSEGTLPFMAMVRLLEETTNYSESTISTLAMSRLLGETSNITEQTLALMALTRLANENININEGLLSSMGFARPLTATVNVGESVEFYIQAPSEPGETLSLFDFVGAVTSIYDAPGAVTSITLSS